MEPALGELTPEFPGEAGDMEIGDVWLMGDRSADNSAVTPTSPSSVPSDLELRAGEEKSISFTALYDKESREDRNMRMGYVKESRDDRNMRMGYVKDSRDDRNMRMGYVKESRDDRNMRMGYVKESREDRNMRMGYVKESRTLL